MKQKIDNLKIATALMLFLAAVWVISGALVFNQATHIGSFGIYVGLAILMFGNAVLITVAAAGVYRLSWPFFWFALLFLAGNTFIVLTDKFNYFDCIIVIINIGIIILLWPYRNKFKKEKEKKILINDLRNVKKSIVKLLRRR